MDKGFHDASWRKNWASDAYLTAGSGGCVNTPPSVMKTVYDNLSQNDPVSRLLRNSNQTFSHQWIKNPY